MLGKMLKSKTIIFNALTIIGAALGGIAAHELIAENPEWAAAIGVAIGAINVVLRMLTSVPISQK